MRTQTSDSESKSEEYSEEYKDYSDDDKKLDNAGSQNLDLNVLLKRLKDKIDSDKRLALLISCVVILISTVVAFAVLN